MAQETEKLLGITRFHSSVAKVRPGETEPYEISDIVSYADTETGEDITDPARIAEFEKEYPNGAD